MRVLIAFDKFKDAITARQAGSAAAGALHAKHPGWQLDLCSLTDGGEGFCETLTNRARGQMSSLAVSGPLAGKVHATHGLVRLERLPVAVRSRLALKETGSLAVIEMAAASGLALLQPEERNPWQTSGQGTGELILAAAEAGADAILLGIGGSATNDLGLGALAALGFKFFDAAGTTVAGPTPARWNQIQRIDPSGATRLPPIFIACDVTNPLLGPNGATATFGPQKGLAPADVPRLEAQVARMAPRLCETCGRPRALADRPGAGAAGGMGFGLMVAYGASLVPGFALVSDWLDLPARLAAADLVLTGEGRYDATSLGGKGPGRLVTAAQRLGKPVHVFCGSLAVPAADHLHVITPAGLSLGEALPRTAELLATAVARVL